MTYKGSSVLFDSQLALRSSTVVYIVRLLRGCEDGHVVLHDTSCEVVHALWGGISRPSGQEKYGDLLVSAAALRFEGSMVVARDSDEGGERCGTKLGVYESRDELEIGI